MQSTGGLASAEDSQLQCTEYAAPCERISRSQRIWAQPEPSTACLAALLASLAQQRTSSDSCLHSNTSTVGATSLQVVLVRVRVCLSLCLRPHLSLCQCLYLCFCRLLQAHVCLLFDYHASWRQVTHPGHSNLLPPPQPSTSFPRHDCTGSFAQWLQMNWAELSTCHRILRRGGSGAAAC